MLNIVSYGSNFFFLALIGIGTAYPGLRLPQLSPVDNAKVEYYRSFDVNARYTVS